VTAYRLDSSNMTNDGHQSLPAETICMKRPICNISMPTGARGKQSPAYQHNVDVKKRSKRICKPLKTLKRGKNKKAFVNIE